MERSVKKEAVSCGVRQSRMVERSAPSATRAAQDDEAKNPGPGGECLGEVMSPRLCEGGMGM